MAGDQTGVRVEGAPGRVADDHLDGLVLVEVVRGRGRAGRQEPRSRQDHGQPDSRCPHARLPARRRSSRSELASTLHSGSPRARRTRAIGGPGRPRLRPAPPSWTIRPMGPLIPGCLDGSPSPGRTARRPRALAAHPSRLRGAGSTGLSRRTPNVPGAAGQEDRAAGWPAFVRCEFEAYLKCALAMGPCRQRWRPRPLSVTRGAGPAGIVVRTSGRTGTVSRRRVELPAVW